MVRFNPFKPGGARIKIDLDRSQGPYYPGDELELEVTLLADTDLNVEKFWCGLVSWEQVTSEDSDGYSTSWKTLDELEAEQVLAGNFEIASGAERTFQLRFWIPKDAFPPCSGIYVSGGLQVQARLELASQKDIIHKIEVPLVVAPPEKRPPAGEHKGSNQPEELVMGLWLPALDP